MKRRLRKPFCRCGRPVFGVICQLLTVVLPLSLAACTTLGEAPRSSASSAEMRSLDPSGKTTQDSSQSPPSDLEKNDLEAQGYVPLHPKKEGSAGRSEEEGTLPIRAKSSSPSTAAAKSFDSERDNGSSEAGDNNQASDKAGDRAAEHSNQHTAEDNSSGTRPKIKTLDTLLGTHPTTAYNDSSLTAPQVLTDIECQRSVMEFTRAIRLLGNKVLTKKLKIGYLIVSDDPDDQRFLFLAPIGVLSSPSGSWKEDYFRCLDDGSYYDAISVSAP